MLRHTFQKCYQRPPTGVTANCTSSSRSRSKENSEYATGLSCLFVLICRTGVTATLIFTGTGASASQRTAPYAPLFFTNRNGATTVRTIVVPGRCVVIVTPASVRVVVITIVLTLALFVVPSASASASASRSVIWFGQTKKCTSLQRLNICVVDSTQQLGREQLSSRQKWSVTQLLYVINRQSACMRQYVVTSGLQQRAQRKRLCLHHGFYRLGQTTSQAYGEVCVRVRGVPSL